MNRNKIQIIIFLLFYIIISFDCIAQMPLITDNTGTQGKGKGQIEFGNGVGLHNEHRCTIHSYEISPVFSYGVIDKVDIIACYPYLYSNIKYETEESNISGLSDINLEVKYQFYQHKSITIAIKPGVSIPTGNHHKELGSGKVSESCFLLITSKFQSMIINGNIGYLRNQNRCGAALNIWHASVDADYSINDKLHLVINTGIEKSPDILDKTPPIFSLIGLYYCINNNIELSSAYKKGLTKAETAHVFVFGLTLRY